MNSKVLLVLRIIFGLFLLFFGSNHLFQFVDPPPPPEEAMSYWEAIIATKVVTLVGIVEIVAGLSLLLNKYSALMMVILMSISVNAMLYHLTLDSAGIPMGSALLVLNIVMLYANKDNYKGLFT